MDGINEKKLMIYCMQINDTNIILLLGCHQQYFYINGLDIKLYIPCTNLQMYNVLSIINLHIYVQCTNIISHNLSHIFTHIFTRKLNIE